MEGRCYGEASSSFKMEEYALIDENRHQYELIIDDDIWKYNVAEQMGVVKLDEKSYIEQVLLPNQQNAQNKQN